MWVICDECEFNLSYMDELLMNVNLNHRGDRDDSSSYSSINVTVVDTVESIIDLSRKRKVRDNCNQLNVKGWNIDYITNLFYVMHMKNACFL